MEQAGLGGDLETEQPIDPIGRIAERSEMDLLSGEESHGDRSQDRRAGTEVIEHGRFRDTGALGDLVETDLDPAGLHEGVDRRIDHGAPGALAPLGLGRHDDDGSGGADPRLLD